MVRATRHRGADGRTSFEVIECVSTEHDVVAQIGFVGHQAADHVVKRDRLMPLVREHMCGVERHSRGKVESSQRRYEACHGCDRTHLEQCEVPHERTRQRRCRPKSDTRLTIERVALGTASK